MPVHSPFVRYLVVAAAFVIVVAGMRAAEQLLVPFLLSLFIAVIASPPLVWLKRRGVPTGIAILMIMGVIIGAGVLVGTVVGSSISSFRQDLPHYQVRLTALSHMFFNQLQPLGIDMDFTQLRESLNPATALALAGTTLSSFGNMMTNAFLIILTVVFILAEEMRFADKLRQANPDCDHTLLAIKRFTQSVNHYMALKTALSFLTGLIIMVWLWVQGVDYFVLWGLLAFLLNFVPTLGSILAAIPAVLLSLVQLGLGDAFITALGFVLVNVVIGNFLEPRIMGRGLDLSPLVVFLSLVFWGWVLGPIGMLLSVPLTMTVKIAAESFEDTRWLGVLLGSGKSTQIATGRAEGSPVLPTPAGNLQNR